ncbi:STAS domain-containing protein [Streptomyces griseus]|uniref:STAS domain-containing protein n=1 Tax=Streptomyces griseus TaxID=1911 RepID=UPI00332A51CD
MDDPGSTTSHALHVVHAPFPGAYVLTLRGTADVTTCAALEDDFATATATGLRLIVDLAALEHGDESLLGLLINAHRTTGIELVGPLSPSFRRRLDTAGITGWFTIRPTLTAALTQ